MERSDESTPRTGSSRRKPATTKRAIETMEGTSDSENEVNEQAPLSPSSSSKMDPSNFSDPQSNELESNVEFDEDGQPILPEGTVLVVPEAVSNTNSPFKGPEFEKVYKKLKAEGNVGEMIICCTSCSSQINHKMTGTVFMHPLLHVVLCKKCKNFYNSGGFTKDENGIDEYCRWCAEGGDLLCCDVCPYAFCKACIRRNFGRSELSKISKLDVWQCLVCDPSPLLELQATCLLVLNYIKKESKRKNEKDLSHPRALFSSPSVNMSHKVALEVCMDNAVQASKILRDGIALLRKKLVSANDPNVSAERVGKKLKKFLQVTKENLDSVAKAVDWELEKIPPIEQTKNANSPAVPSSSSTKNQNLEKTVPIQKINTEPVSDSNQETMLDKPEDLMKTDESEDVGEAPAKTRRSTVKKSDETINGSKMSLSKKNCKESNSLQSPENEESSAELSCNDEPNLPDVEDVSDCAAENATEEHMEESESLENITPDDDDKSGDNVREDADIVRSCMDELLDETVLDNDTTLSASHVSPLKNNDNINQRASRKNSKKVEKNGEDERSPNKLKIVIKKLPTTNDLDKEVVKKDKSERKSNKQNHRKEKNKIDGKSCTKREKKAGKDLLENSTLDDDVTEDGDVGETVMYQIESNVEVKAEVANDAESGSDGELKDKEKLEMTGDNSNAPDSETETLLGDYNIPDPCESPKAKSEDGEIGDAKRDNHSETADQDSDTETLPRPSDSIIESNVLETSALEDDAASSGNDSGNDACMGDEPCIESDDENEDNLKDNSCTQAEDENEDNLKDNSCTQAEDESAEKSVNGDDASSINDEAEQDSKGKHKNSPNRATKSKKKLGLEAAPDNNTATALKGLPSDKNKVAKHYLLNCLAEDSDEEVEKLTAELEETQDGVEKNAKKHSKKGTAKDLQPQDKDVSPEKDIADAKEDGTALAETSELSAAALAKKKLLSCLQSDSDNDDEILALAAAATEQENRKASVHGKGGSPSKSSPTKRIPKPRSARTADEITSGSSLSSDEEVTLPKTKAARKIIPIADVEKFINEDPKLKLKVTVALQRLKPGVEKELATCGYTLVKRRQKANLSKAEALNRDINKLCSLKSLKLKKRKNQESDSDGSGSDSSKSKTIEEKGKKPANVLKGKKAISDNKKPKKDDFAALFTSSSEDENQDMPDLDDEDSKDSKGKVNNVLNDKNDIETNAMNKRAKDMLIELLNMSSDDQSDDGDDDAKKKSKNAKKEKDEKKSDNGDSDDGSGKNNSDDDSEDFTPVKKNKRFASKLLRAKLSDSDESYKASSDSRDVKKRKKRSGTNSKASGTSESSDDSSDDPTSPVKPRKRKTRGNAKSSTSTDGDSLSGARKKKRRRIKTMTDSSDSDVKVIDDKNASSTGKGRKNIRRLIGDTKLRDDTKIAAREEEERRNRVTELQKKYNVVIVGSGKDGAPITQKLVLEKDPKTKESLVEVHPDLISKLKPHQVDGVKFLWESMCESLDRLQTHHGSGCILAHCMGLGKTLQVITFLHTLLANENTWIKTALVVCPLNTVVNWFMEFRSWLDEIEPALEVTELSSIKSNYERARAMKHWTKEGGILIIGYEMFRNLVQEKAKRMPKSCRETFQTALINPGPDVVVCDEGHLLKNSATSLSKSMTRISTRRRVVLTGTPLQNNLAEYHCMVDFVKPSLLGTMKEFKNRFVNPIQNGQCADSTSQDVRIMKRRAHILHNLLDGCVQRRDYNVLTPFLPQKHEYVISIRLTDIQVKLYVYYLENLARKSSRSSSLFADYQQLMRIWTHPRVIRLAEIRQENKIRLAPGKHKKTATKCMSFPNGQRPSNDDSENSFIDDGSSESESESNMCIDNDEEPSTSKGRKQGDGTSDDEVVNNWKSRSRGGRQNADKDGDADKFEIAPEQSRNWWTEFISEDDAKKFEHSGKLILLFSILKECYHIGDKLLLFSQSLLSLDLIETMLQESKEEDEEGNENQHYAGRWVNGTDYFRLDGSTSAETRSRYTRIFNDNENLTARLFLISTRAGSLGINLVAANRVIVFDASWNPSHDVQSIFRVYRFGQEKPVYVYRFLAHGTMEEKIYDRQVTKQSLACRVVDEQQIERHFNFADLQELYTFTPERVSKRPTPMLPKDRLLAELVMKKKDLIVNYHEHDSLLVNQEAEELSEEERKAAWVEYEVERKGMMDASGQQMSQGLYGVKLDIAYLIHEIQTKEPGLSVPDLTSKLRDTMSAIHQARRDALEQQRQEILRVQLQSQQREYMAAQQKREIMAQVQQRIAHGDLTPEQVAWYSQVMGPDHSPFNKLIHQSSSNVNHKPLLTSVLDSSNNTTKK